MPFDDPARRQMPRTGFLMLSGVAGVLLVFAGVGFFWLARFLLPEWFRVLRGDAVCPKGYA